MGRKLEGTRMGGSMSAYVVEPETIGRIVVGLARSQEYITEELRELGYSMDKEFAKVLHEMNVAAVCQRYSQDSPGMYDFEYVGCFATKIQVIKSLTCYLYQCLEGDVPGRPLYKALKKIRDQLCYEYVANTPEYDKAVWG